MASKRKTELSAKLKKDEKQVLKQIEEELKKGDTTLYNSIMYPEYKEVPVDRATFITDKRYLGNLWTNSAGRLTMFPFWWDWFTKRKDDKNTIVFSGSTGCVDGDTEYFNGKQWKKISQYKQHELVLQYNITTEIANLVKPSRYIKKEDSEMYVLRSKKGISQVITDDHNFVYRRGNKVAYIPFCEVRERIEQGTLDGSIIATYKYSGKGIEADNETIRFGIGLLLDSRKGENTFESWWYDADENQQEIIKEEIDKRIKNRCIGVCDSMVYVTSDKKIADFVQYIFSTQGKKATISNEKGQYRVAISKNDKTRFYRSKLIQDKIVDTSYCFEVPSGALVLRRDGKIFITGNCGKTSISVVCFLYDLYKVMCLKNPREYYGLDGKKKIMFLAINPLGLQVARENAWGTIQASVQESPWFRERGVIRGQAYPTWYPRGSIGLKFGSLERHITGLDVYSAIFDEISEQSGDMKRQQQKSLRMVLAATERQTSRFDKAGRPNPTRTYLASSKKTEMSFLENYIQERIKTKDPNIEIIDRPRWEILPKKDFDWTKKIYVGLGDKARPNMLLGVDIEDKVKNEYIEQGYKILEAPYSKSMHESFEANIDLALCNICGISVANMIRYISGQRWHKCVEQDGVRAFKQDVYVVGTDDAAQYIDFYEDVFSLEFKRKKVFLHMDTSFAKDKTGIAVSTIDHIEKGVDGSKRVIYRILFAFAIQSPQNAEISFEKNENFIVALKKIGWRIAKITMDSMQSKETQQRLQAMGYVVEYLSMDRVNSDKVQEPYLAFKNIVNEQRIISPPNELLAEEISLLERDQNTGKIDHPPKGSKDTVDAVAGSIWNASQAIDEFLHEFGYSDVERMVRANDGNRGKRVLDERASNRFDETEIAKKLDAVKTQLFDDTINKNSRGASIKTTKQKPTSKSNSPQRRIFVR